MNKKNVVSNDNYPSMHFLDVRETLIKKSIETLSAHRRSIEEELLRLNAELECISKIRELYHMDNDKYEQVRL